MKHYLFYWRLGWVAGVVLALTLAGLNVVGRLTRLVLAQNATLENMLADSLPKRIIVVGIVFLVLGLPYAGWVFDLGARKASSLVRPSEGRAEEAR